MSISKLKIDPRTMNKTTLVQRVILVCLGILLSLILIEAGLRAGGFVIRSVKAYKADGIISYYVSW